MELQQLRYVVAVADTGGFTRAAERCHVVQSALSHQIGKLERELGARLFDRTSRQVRPTRAGEAFLPAARATLAAAERARAEVAAATGEVRGRLAIGSIPTVAAVNLPAALKEFHDTYPQVRISLAVGASEHLVRAVAEGTYDLALLGVPAGFRADKVRERILVRDRHLAVLPPDHPLAGTDETDLARLAEETFVDFAAGTAARAQSEEAFAAAGLRRTVGFEVSSMDFMADLVRAGLGVALLPSTFAPRLPGLATVRIADGPSREERLIWPRTRPSPAAAAFLHSLGVTPGEDDDGDTPPA